MDDAKRTILLVICYFVFVTPFLLLLEPRKEDHRLLLFACQTRTLHTAPSMSFIDIGQLKFDSLIYN